MDLNIKNDVCLWVLDNIINDIWLVKLWHTRDVVTINHPRCGWEIFKIYFWDNLNALDRLRRDIIALEDRGRIPPIVPERLTYRGGKVERDAGRVYLSSLRKSLFDPLAQYCEGILRSDQRNDYLADAYRTYFVLGSTEQACITDGAISGPVTTWPISWDAVLNDLEKVVSDMHHGNA